MGALSPPNVKPLKTFNDKNFLKYWVRQTIGSGPRHYFDANGKEVKEPITAKYMAEFCGVSELKIIAICEELRNEGKVMRLYRDDQCIGYAPQIPSYEPTSN